MEIDALVLQGAPEAFDEDVVHPTPLAIHADPHLGVAQHAVKHQAGGLGGFNRSWQRPDVGGCKDSPYARCEYA